jgi:cytochrome c oxidase subunit 4
MPVHDTAHEVRTYLIIFGCLAALTLITVGVAYLHLPHAAAVVVAVGIAFTKVALIALFFMHLKTESSLIHWSMAVALGLILLLLVFVLPDLGVLDADLVHNAPAPLHH